MAESFIDSSSIHQVVQAFALGSERQYPWSTKALIHTTALLLGTNSQHLPPALHGRKGFYPGDLAFARDELLRANLFLPAAVIDQKTANAARGRTRTWSKRNIPKLDAYLSALFNDHTSFMPWLAWTTEQMWTDNQVSNGVLLDSIFEKQIRQALGFSENDYASLDAQSRDRDSLADIVKHQHDSRQQDFNQLAKAYVLSFLLRGRYYDYAAQSSSSQITQHALRSDLFNDDADNAIPYQVTNTCEALARIAVFGAASSQKTTHDRIACWVNNLTKLRPLVFTGELYLGNLNSDEAAYDVAAKAAHDAGVEMGGKKITKYLDAAVALGIGVLTGIALHGWIGWTSVPIVVGTEEAIRRSDVLEWAGHAARNRPARLRDIGAGRIRFKWRDSH